MIITISIITLILKHIKVPMVTYKSSLDKAV